MPLRPHLHNTQQAISTGNGVGASLLSPLPFPKHLVKMLLNLASIRQNSGTKCKGQSERSSGFFSQPFPSPISGDATTIWKSWTAVYSQLPITMCVKKVWDKEVGVLSSKTLTLQREVGAAASCYRITFNHCCYLGSYCRSGPGVSHRGWLCLQGWVSVYLLHVRFLSPSSCLTEWILLV